MRISRRFQTFQNCISSVAVLCKLVHEMLGGGGGGGVGGGVV